MYVSGLLHEPVEEVWAALTVIPPLCNTEAPSSHRRKQMMSFKSNLNIKAQLMPLISLPVRALGTSMLFLIEPDAAHVCLEL